VLTAANPLWRPFAGPCGPVIWLSLNVSAPFTPQSHKWIWSRGGPIVRSREAALRREDSIVFVIRLLDGEEVHAAEGDKLTINEQTGVLSVLRVDGFEEVTTHYSPSAWASVTHRIKEHVVRPSLVGSKK
jgi:hypothetical protein